MNRKQRRLRSRQKAKLQRSAAGVQVHAPENAQKIVDNLPVPAIIAGVNNLLSQLEQRKIPICDWDEPARRLCRLQMWRGKVYCLTETEGAEKDQLADQGKKESSDAV